MLLDNLTAEYAKEVFTPEFTKRESQGHAEVVVAIFKTL